MHTVYKIVTDIGQSTQFMSYLDKEVCALQYEIGRTTINESPIFVFLSLKAAHTYASGTLSCLAILEGITQSQPIPYAHEVILNWTNLRDIEYIHQFWRDKKTLSPVDFTTKYIQTDDIATAPNNTYLVYDFAPMKVALFHAEDYK